MVHHLTPAMLDLTALTAVPAATMDLSRFINKTCCRQTCGGGGQKSLLRLETMRHSVWSKNVAPA